MTTATAIPARKQQVLIVDDDPSVRLVCAVNLEAAGLDVLHAGDGSDGLALALEARPDLVLTDVRMPRLGGFELADALRADTRTQAIPLIFLSGETDIANEDRARSLGALAYLRKPFEPSHLIELVSRALTQHDACAETHQAAEPEPVAAK